MTLDLNLNDTSAAILGGILIAIASTLNLLLKGRITGLSGIYFGLVSFEKDAVWKISFLNGMLLASCIMRKYVCRGFFNSPSVFIGDISILGLIIAGYLVGLGTKLANGCTSGHGVCGLPRLSIRSIIAVTVFMSAGVATATLRYHYPFFYSGDLVNLAINLNTQSIETVFLIIFALNYIIFLIVFTFKKDWGKVIEYILSSLFGAIFSAGLIISGMCQRTKILAFLTIFRGWDISLLFVMLSAVIVNFFTFFYVINILKKPIFNDSLQLPTNKDITPSLIIGSLIFGIGWGIGGLCPGPAIVDSFIYIPHMFIFLIMVAIGQHSAVAIENLVKMLLVKKAYGKFIEA